MFIIDFDDTLFETEKYKLARMESLSKVGVPETVFWDTYQAARLDSDGLFAYSDERHAGMLAKIGYDEQKMLHVLHSVTDKTVAFLDAQAITFLSELKKYNEPLILLSLGDPATQELKIKAAGIQNYFERLFLVEKNKRATVEELLTCAPAGESVWFINDKPQETAEIGALFPRLRVVAKISPRFTSADYEALGLSYFQTLGEILNYVRKFYK